MEMTSTAAPVHYRGVTLDAYRRNWLSQAEISEDHFGQQDRVGLSFFFLDPVELQAFLNAAALPSEPFLEEARLRQTYDLIPRHWIKLHFLKARRNGFSQYFVLEPNQAYPITTLRQLVRRYPNAGSDPSALEPGLEPALQQEDAMWAAILKNGEGRRVLRLSTLVRRERLASLLNRMSDHGLIASHMGEAHLAMDREMEADPSVYVTFEPGTPQVLALDYQHPSPSLLDKIGLGGEKNSPRYLKCRLDDAGRAVWTAYRPLPDVLPDETLAALCQADVSARAAQAYFDRLADTIATDVGLTYQAAQLPGGSCDTNLQLAVMAGIEPAMKVLDLGCGAAGPAIDIARHFADVTMVGLTLSARQARLARSSVESAGLADRIVIRHKNYETAEYSRGEFHRAVFFESLGYAENLPRLFERLRYALVPGGKVFIKDAFVNDGPHGGRERLELAEFQRVYRFRGYTRDAVAAALRQAGWCDVTDVRLDARYDLNRFHRAMEGTSFGHSHFRRYLHLPVAFRVVTATNPG